MFLILFITLVLSLFVYSFIVTTRYREIVKQWKGPPWVPIIGNVYIYSNKQPKDVINLFWKLLSDYGATFYLWVGHRVSFFSTDPNIIEHILSSQKHIAKNNLYSFLVPWLGNGLLLSTGKKWFNKRKTITPTFHFKILEQFTEVFERQGDVLIQKLMEKADGKEFNIYNFVTLFALDVVSETAMGTEINAQTNTESEYVRAVQEISFILAERFIKVWRRVDLLFNMTDQKRRQDNAIKVMHDFTINIIQSRRKAISVTSEKPAELSEESEFGIKKKMALLDVLLQSKIDDQPLTDEEIQEEVDTFMFEGHDTTTGAISFTTYVLSKHPEIQKKLFDEIQTVAGHDSEVPLTHRNLQDLKYLDLVLKESMRLFPPVPIIGRRLNEDAVIDGKIIPAGSNFNLGIYFMHRNPKYFADPEKFIPERFEVISSVETTNPYVYIPFSAGPRNCIGQKFAILELKSAMSKIIRNFEILPGSQEPNLIIQLTLRSQNGVFVGLRKRKND